MDLIADHEAQHLLESIRWAETTFEEKLPLGVRLSFAKEMKGIELLMSKKEIDEGRVTAKHEASRNV